MGEREAGTEREKGEMGWGGRMSGGGGCEILGWWLGWLVGWLILLLTNELIEYELFDE